MNKEMDMTVVLNRLMRLICSEQKERAISVVFKLNNADFPQPASVSNVMRYYLILAWEQEHASPKRQEVSLGGMGEYSN